MLNSKDRASGFTLIELMVGLSVVGILFMLGMPDLQAWTRNTQIRVATGSVLIGLQIARTEAVRRNRNVRMELSAGPADWQVRIDTPPALGATDPDPVQRGVSREGASTALVTITPVGATAITFNGMGAVISNADGSASITQVDVTSTVTYAARHPLRVTVGAGGALRMCDPDATLKARIPPDPRSC